MKRIALFLMSCFLLCCCLAFAACGEEGETMLSSYGFVQDFSNKQGYRGWWYLFGDENSDTGYSPMTYHEDFAEYRGEDFWSRISIYNTIPGLNSEVAVAFQVPRACTASVVSTIYRNPPDGFGIGQDGVWYYAFANEFTTADELLFSEYVVDDEIMLHTLTFERVCEEGDVLYFVINSRANQSNDNCVFDISIGLN